jgi:hypothetical protein
MVLTLFVVPSAYLILHEIVDRLQGWLLGGERRAAEASDDALRPTVLGGAD